VVFRFEDEAEVPESKPYKLCTFSRVMKEKGIEDAIAAVKAINQKCGRIIFTLDNYGQIDDGYKEKFSSMQKSFPSYIRYAGLVPFDQSVETIRNYFALLFPTYYHGEGFAGALIDAMAAGTPVIASDWRFNKEVVKPGKTGVLIKDCNAEKIEKELMKIAENPDGWNAMRLTTLEEAHRYEPNEAIKPLMERLQSFNFDCAYPDE
jgi:glycosyltransferase involved in cell wall biosynthesis